VSVCEIGIRADSQTVFCALSVATRKQIAKFLAVAGFKPEAEANPPLLVSQEEACPRIFSTLRAVAGIRPLPSGTYPRVAYS